MILSLDSLNETDGESEDLIDDFFTGRMWEGGLPGGQVLTGVIQQESPLAPRQESVVKRNLYVVRTTQGHMIPDCILLSPHAYGTTSKNRFDADKLPGQYSKPYAGAFCVVLTSNGGVAFIAGFWNPPTQTSPNETDKVTSETNPGSIDDVDARTNGDWIIRSEKGLINVKRMGAIIIESGASIRQTMNPLDGTHFSQCKTRLDIAEGYRASRGRVHKEFPEALAEEEFFDRILQRGSTSIAVRIRNGKVDDTVRRELTVAKVDFAVPTDPVETILARESYLNDGSWISEGPKYQWGGSSADEPVVLGNALVTIIKRLSSIIRAIKVPTAWGPSGTPLPPTPTDLISLDNDLDDILSNYMFTTKEPVEP